jgi:hypothetical protein
MRPPDKDIQLALEIQWAVPEQYWPLYMKCMNNKPMDERNTPQELRDGCILTHHVFLFIYKDKTGETLP